MSDSGPQFLTVGTGADARRIAVRDRPGADPRLLWLGGFMSDMKGTKAEALDQWGAATGRAVTRFDYSGHGESEGRFEDGTISKWLDEAEAVFAAYATGPTILVGSSMGGWISLLLARRLKEKAISEAKALKRDAGGKPVPTFPHPALNLERDAGGKPVPTFPHPALAGMILIAPAADFTERLMWDAFPDDVKDTILRDGVWHRPSPYGEAPYPITKALIEDGRANLLYGDAPIETGCPVHILQGVQDDDVPWAHVTDLVSRLARDDVVLTLIKDGDHRLSRPQDIERLITAVEGIGD